MQRVIRQAVGASDKVMHKGNRCGSDEGGDYYQILEDIGDCATIRRHAGPEFSEQQSRRRRFDIKTPDRVALPDEVLGGGIVQRIPAGIVDLTAGVPGDRGEGVTNDSERTVSEEVDLDEPCFFRLVLFPLNDRQTFCRELHRHIAPDLIRDDDHAAAMHRQVAKMMLRLQRSDQNLRPGCGQLQGLREFTQPFRVCR